MLKFLDKKKINESLTRIVAILLNVERCQKKINRIFIIEHFSFSIAIADVGKCKMQKKIRPTLIPKEVF